VLVTRPKFTYEPVPDWGRLPPGLSFGNEATSVAVDSEDLVYVFNRGPVPLMVFDPDGNYLHGWGEGEFHLPHGIGIDPEDHLYLVDLGHTVQKRTRDGKLLFSIGGRDRRALPHSGLPFNRPTDIAVHPESGELFVSDGYGNSTVHRFSPGGALLASFGGPGSETGEFSLPHGVCFLGSDRLVVCDRENFRLQVFTLEGEPLEQWHHYYPMAVRSVCGPDGEWNVWVGEGPAVRYQRHTPNLGCRVKVLDGGGHEVGRAGAGGWGFEDDHFTCIHGLAVDSRGDIYVAECPYMTLTRYYEEEAPPGELLSLRKWQRSSG
jgi:hypothetical protein